MSFLLINFGCIFIVEILCVEKYDEGGRKDEYRTAFAMVTQYFLNL
jgi:hypothetical protein